MSVAKFSEIEAFWFRHPDATPEMIHEFTSEPTKRLCDCGLQMRRFECWNGECEVCRKSRGATKTRECGCMKDSEDGGFWLERLGWHYDGSTAVERCPTYWSREVRDKQLEKRVGGQVVKRSATVRYHVHPDDRQKIVATYYDDSGEEIPMNRRSDYGSPKKVFE